MKHKYNKGQQFKMNGQEKEPDYLEILEVSPTTGSTGEVDEVGCTYCYFIKETTWDCNIYTTVQEPFLDVYCSQIMV